MTGTALIEELQRQLGAELIETHISWVLLADDLVYKIKKPLDLGFLDFSTLEKRRFYCDEELRLNRRLAPDIYLEVVAIGDDGQLGATRAVEYAVKMRRFPQSAQLDRMLQRGELQAAQIDAFARMCADFHSRVAVAGEESGYGEPQQVWRPVEENFAQIREHLAADRAGDTLAVIERWSQQQFRRLEPLLGKRKAQGFIRECHGDMHLRNLAWVEERPVAFDCIEFNPALRWIDVISEIAFLVMDLQERGEARLAQRFLNRYLERSGDYAGLALLPFYQVYRAMVRAKVAAIRSDQPSLEAGERDEALAEVDAYLANARGYTAEATPSLIVMRGLSASGKSTLSALLMERPETIRLRSDVERKRLFGLTAEEDGSAEPGEGIYSAEAGERTYRRLQQLAGELLDAGYSVVIDAACLQRWQRDYFYRLADERKLPCLLLSLEVPAEELRRRIRQRKRGASDADLAVLERQLANVTPPEPDERWRTLSVVAEELSERLLGRVAEQLAAMAAHE